MIRKISPEQAAGLLDGHQTFAVYFTEEDGSNAGLYAITRSEHIARAINTWIGNPKPAKPLEGFGMEELS